MPHRKRLIRASFLASTALCALAATPAEAGNGSVTFTYDAVGRVTSAVYDTGVTLQYNYDPSGNRTQQVLVVGTSPGAPPPAPPAPAAFPPGPAGPPGPPGSPGGASYSYDALGRLTAIAYDTGVVGQYNYDAAGNRTSVVTTTGNTLGAPPSPAPPQPSLPTGPPGAPPPGTGAVSYSYDPLGRVATANYDNSVFIQYTYDAAGNRTQQLITTGTP